jgi:hypothetical protein
MADRAFLIENFFAASHGRGGSLPAGARLLRRLILRVNGYGGRESRGAKNYKITSLNGWFHEFPL